MYSFYQRNKALFVSPIYSFDHLNKFVYTGAQTLNEIYTIKRGKRRIESKSKLIVEN